MDRQTFNTLDTGTRLWLEHMAEKVGLDAYTVAANWQLYRGKLLPAQVLNSAPTSLPAWDSRS